MKSLWIAMLCAAMALPGVGGGEPAAPVVEMPAWVEQDSGITEVGAWSLELADGAVLATSVRTTAEAAPVTRRSYTLADGSRVVMGRAELNGGTAAVETVTLPEGEGTVRFFDDAGQWVEEPLADGVYRASAVEIVLEDMAFFCYLPKTYREAPRSSLIVQPAYDGALTVEETRDGWQVTLTGSAPAGDHVCDFTWAVSDEPFLDWIRDHWADDWYNYTQDGAGKWCFDGYYRTTPATYSPTGTGYLYRCPAAYVVDSMVEAAQARSGARALATAMVHTMVRNQNGEGFWETGPESQWLSGDYGIGPGFYDTRFNSDLAGTLCTFYEAFGGDFVRAALERYADFYLEFAAANHRETAGGGWLVEDYGGDGANGTMHTSLNHQLAECLVLFRLGAALDRAELTELAGRLLQAVEDTGAGWINAAGDLHYSVSADGVYSGTDYPYLTYNDLLALNTWLRTQTGSDSAVLRTLMTAKRSWMDANGVTGYDLEGEAP